MHAYQMTMGREENVIWVGLSRHACSQAGQLLHNRLYICHDSRCSADAKLSLNTRLRE